MVDPAAPVVVAEDLPFFFFFDFLDFGGGVSSGAGLGVETVGESNPPGRTVGGACGLVSAGVGDISTEGAAVCFFSLPLFATEVPPAAVVDGFELEPWLSWV